FAWCAILTTLLTFLARGQTINNILLIAMAVLSAIRITAYYNEDLSRDLSKILPFAMLGVFLIDVSYFALSTSVDSLLGALLSWKTIVYYLGFMIGLEFIMRITTPVLKPIFAQGQSPESGSSSGTATSGF
ncbi:MAG: hypothetical protein ACE5Q6_27355, partial [Dehalococcoidia bacterium]